MNIELSPEQQEAIIVSVLSRDYTNIVTGYYSDDCMKYKEAFETLFQFYLTDAQREALAPPVKKESISKEDWNETCPGWNDCYYCDNGYFPCNQYCIVMD